MVLILEWSNPETLGPLSVPVKLQASLFQSVTLRTAGFFTISQKGLYNSTAFLCLIFIGNSRNLLYENIMHSPLFPRAMGNQAI